MFSFKALEVAFLLQVRGQEVERGGSVGLGHRRRQLRHLQEPHHGPLHRVPGQPGPSVLLSFLVPVLRVSLVIGLANNIHFQLFSKECLSLMHSHLYDSFGI